MKKAILILGLAGLAALLSIPGASLYYESGGGKNCARCHEIGPAYERWHVSTHRNIACAECHGDAFTLDAAFHWNNFHRVRTHLSGDVPERPRLRESDFARLLANCQRCHRQEFADWQASAHSATYQRIFTDTKHNHDRLLMDDCLRCHGMHFEGGIESVVTPVNQEGPWRLKDPARAARPTMPCLACHSMHRAGEPLKGKIEPRKQEFYRPSLAFFDRRDMMPVAASLLPLPVMKEGERAVRMSPDPRQKLCYQCHAPLAGAQAASGDDRTPLGVHEGLSCLACHQRHRQETRASCATCHPRLSNCNRDVETMDTTFFNKDSKHNIHWVKCADCHPKGIPPKRAPR